MNEISKDQALLLMGDSITKQKIIRVLQRLSYKTVIIPFITDDTMEQIKRVPFKVIIIEDGFQNFRK